MTIIAIAFALAAALVYLAKPTKPDSARQKFNTRFVSEIAQELSQSGESGVKTLEAIRHEARMHQILHAPLNPALHIGETMIVVRARSNGSVMYSVMENWKAAFAAHKDLAERGIDCYVENYYASPAYPNVIR